uniref:Uncharacterized protein n=1 Tax=Avena sativa TaxID=4498 RepID=A0ACD6A743_AVESA
MDLATGAMGSLLPKLVQLLGEEYKLHKGIKGDIKFLEGELRSMHAALRKVGDVQRDQLDELVKIWADEVRDLSYDMEDVADSFLVRVQGFEPDTNSHKLKRLVKQMGDLLSKGKTRHKIAGEIKDIKVRVKEVADRRDRYRVDSIVANPAAATAIDPRLLMLYKQNQEIVGAEEARDELIKRLTDGEDGASKLQLKILSIFGFGGLGKTTLAKEVYDRLQAQYACKAFVVVGRNPDVKKVLKDILLGIDKQKYMDFNLATLDERQLIDELREQLVNKRYFIVIDDIWDTETWGIIRCAFMDSDCGSRIITTTRIFEVAKKAGDVYRIKPLSPEKSEELFYTRLSGDKNKCNYDQQVELSEKILRKCGGVPLAIIAIASLLASKPMDDWSKVYNSIGFGSGHNEDVENMRKILLYSYYDMPSYLRTCLLHLSIHEEDVLIHKEKTIWKWVAEGFVCEEPDMGSFEVGERYLDELINRSMVRPCQPRPHGPVTYYYVHDLVLDMICSLSKEEKFVSILGSDKQSTSLRGNVRRLAIQNGVIDKNGPLINTHTQQLRSFNVTSCVIDVMLPLEKFQALRVLDLYMCTYLDGRSCNLEHLGKLLQLRYLGLHDTPVTELPEEIGNLKFLQTLDITQTRIRELPSRVSLLRQLKSLCMSSCSVRVPDWMGNLTSLEDLVVDNVSESPNFVKELGKLTELRTLVIDIGDLGAESSKCNAFVESLEKLQKIKELRIFSKREANLETHVPSRQLHDLTLRTSSPRLPVWINSLLLPNLTYLFVTLKAVKEHDVVTLGRLPELLAMELIVDISDGGYSYPCECSGGAFPKLKHSDTPAPLLALKGAMPSIEIVSFTVYVRPLKDSNFDFDFSSLGNLPLLEKATAHVICTGATAREVEEAEAALRRAVQVHPNRPFLLLERMGKDIPAPSTVPRET